MIFVELEGLDVTRVTFGSNGIHTRFVRLAGIVRTSFLDEPYLFSAHLQEDGALEFKKDRHAQNVHTVKDLAFVVCRAKGRLRLAVLSGSGLVRSFGVLVFRSWTSCAECCKDLELIFRSHLRVRSLDLHFFLTFQADVSQLCFRFPLGGLFGCAGWHGGKL